MKLLGLGDNVIDCYTNTGAVYPGGNALNVAIHASILGAEAAYMGNLSDDSMSEVIVDALNHFHVDFSRCRKIPGTVTKCCRYRVINGERTYLGITAGDAWSGPLQLQADDMEYLTSFSLIHSSCNAKMEDEMFRLAGLPSLFTYDSAKKKNTDAALIMIRSAMDWTWPCFHVLRWGTMRSERFAGRSIKEIPGWS